MSTEWLVDDGPFGELARVFDPGWSWPAGTLHLVEEVASAAVLDKSGRRSRLLGMRSDTGDPAIVVHALALDSPAAEMLYEYLRPDSTNTTKNLGEHASIAYVARENASAVFVAADKGACFLALGELGRSRVASPLDLWFDLAARQLISQAQCQTLCETTVRLSALPGVPSRFAL
jgi:hypothetical protein